jgi:hypothetical protein
MRHALFVFIIIPFSFYGCMTKVSYCIKYYSLNDTCRITAGSDILKWEEGVRDKEIKPYRQDYDSNERYWEALKRYQMPGRHGEGRIFELLYKNTIGGIMNLIYREYLLTMNNAIMRESFNYEINYDLKESNKIAFKDFSIDVIDASQAELIYHVYREPKRLNELEEVETVWEK